MERRAAIDRETPPSKYLRDRVSFQILGNPAFAGVLDRPILQPSL
jgi:hypothetical protein